eukprot:m.15318 g.15318  ORF g.15318 m.15318 type:complete len:345 (-) comp10529_c0_seq1:169-1203(-)
MIASTSSEYFRAGFAEFIATLLFVFFGVGSVCALGASGSAPTPINYALGFGFGITLLATSIGGISGGHMNPSISLAMVVTGNISVTKFFIYIFAQFTGGIFGGGLLWGMVDGEYSISNEFGNSTEQRNLYATGLGLHDSITPAQGLFIEMMGTLLLLYTVFFIAVSAGNISSKSNSASMNDVISAMAPLPIGFSVVVAHLFAGPFTGCGINPARALGAAVWADEAFWESRTGEHFWIYFIGPVLAALVVPLIQWVQHGYVRPADIQEHHQDYKRAYSHENEPVVKHEVHTVTQQKNPSYDTGSGVYLPPQEQPNPAQIAVPTIYKRTFARPDSVHVTNFTSQDA